MPKADSEKRLPDGTLIEFRSRTYGVKVVRVPYVATDGVVRYAEPWVVRKTVSKETQAFRLGTNQKSAEKLADEIAAFLSIPQNTMAQAVAKYNPRQEARGTATVGECLDAFEKALGIIGRRGAPVSDGTFKGYRSNVLKVLRRVQMYRDGKEWVPFMGMHHIDFSPWLKLSTDILTARLVQDYKLASVPSLEEADEEEVISARISCDSTLLNARAVFSKRALQYFAQVGMKLPELSSFLSEPSYNARRFFELLPPEVITTIMRESMSLRDENVDAYRAFILSMHCGLRAAEAKAFGLDWLRDEDRPMIYVRVRGEFNPKHGKGRRVALTRWVYDLLLELGPLQKADAAQEDLTTWLRARLPEGARIQKPIHELRKCWVSSKAKMEGLLAAAQQAGHSDPKVTQTHYGDNQMSDRLIPFWRLPPAQAINS